MLRLRSCQGYPLGDVVFSLLACNLVLLNQLIYLIFHLYFTYYPNLSNLFS